jgi:hypothetical protein
VPRLRRGATNVGGLGGHFGAPSKTEATMPSDETRRVLKVFGIAITNLEDAIDQHKPVDEIMKWDNEVAERTREMLALVDRLRSRRIG